MLPQLGIAYQELFTLLGWQLGIAAAGIILYCLARL
jgi:hypothetical protein